MVGCPNGHPVLDAGSRFCLRCGAPLVDPEAGRAATFACAVHPDRTAQAPCRRCGTFACAGCLSALPDGSSLCAACLGREQQSLPWDHRAEVGTLRAFWQTSMRILRRPSVVFATTPSSASVGDSLWFSTLATIVASFSTLVIYGLMIVGVVVALTLGGDRRDGAAAGVGISVAVFAGMLVLTVGVGVAYVLFNAALDHLVLRMVGDRVKGFGVTLRASALSLAPALIGLVPLCGYYVFFVWALVIRVFAYRAFHELPTRKAVIGAITVPGVLMILFTGFYALAVYWTSAMGR